VQSFISTTNDELASLIKQENETVFHVKHGSISTKLS
jgi:recombinational DNA repair ATPase RecF